MTDFGCTTATQEKPRLLFYATREEIVSALRSAPEEVRYSILVETCPDSAYAAAVKRAEKAESERDQAKAEVERLRRDLNYIGELTRILKLSVTVPTDSDRIAAAIEKAAADGVEPELGPGSRWEKDGSVIDDGGDRVYVDSGLLQCRNRHGEVRLPRLADARALIWRHDHAQKENKA